MAAITKAKVLMDGLNQLIQIPSEFHLDTNEVLIHRDPSTGELILSPSAGDWANVFSELDQAGIPDEFLSDRQQDAPQERRAL